MGEYINAVFEGMMFSFGTIIVVSLYVLIGYLTKYFAQDNGVLNTLIRFFFTALIISFFLSSLVHYNHSGYFTVEFITLFSTVFFDYWFCSTRDL